MRIAGYNKNLTGNKYGRLTVIGPADRKGSKHRYWSCLCSCGNVTPIRHNHLTGQTVRSCGCSHFYTGNKHAAWKGYKSIPGTYLSVVKQSARKRNLPFEVSLRQMWNVFEHQKGKCALSGEPLVFNKILRSTDGNASLDRIDSSRGYTIDNIQWVHKSINVMKQDLTDAEFVAFCHKIVSFRKDLL